jgi:ATP-dependent DNA helicase RecQ
MVRFAQSEMCRHQAIAAYFDDRIDACQEACDNCLQPDVTRVDITTPSRKFLSALVRTGQNFGLHYIVDVLRGSKEKRLLDNGHDTLSVYGIGGEYSKAQWLTIADRLLELGAFTMGEYKVGKLSPFGLEVLKGAHTITLREDRLKVQKTSRSKIALELDDYDAELFEKLKKLRLEIARESEIPPYIVFSDKTLKELSVSLPRSREEMLQVHGIGEVKFERYGERFLAFLGECQEESVTSE